VKKSVQEMTRKTLDPFKLSQIITVYPEAFNLRYDNQTKLSKGNTTKIECVLVVMLGGDHATLSPSVILQRKRTFAKLLLGIVKKHHQNYLNNLDTPITINDNQLIRWHPSFELDGVPDIEPNRNSIPVPPIRNDIHNINSAESCLETTRLRLGIKSPSKEGPSTLDNQASPVKITKGALKGISTALLEKIRAKEAQKITKEMTRSPETEKKISMIGRLPDFLRIINNYFVGERKATLSVENVVNKCKDSYYTCISAPEAHEHIKLIGQLLPDWLFLLDVKKGTFVKIDKTKSIEDLIKRLNKTSEFLQQGRGLAL